MITTRIYLVWCLIYRYYDVASPYLDLFTINDTPSLDHSYLAIVNTSSRVSHNYLDVFVDDTPRTVLKAHENLEEIQVIYEHSGG